MLTIGEINNTISELRSKIAIYETLVLYVRTNYVAADDGAPEMHFTRDDSGRVPQEHITTSIVELIDTLDGMKLELDKWESTPLAELLNPPKAEVPATLPEPKIESKPEATEPVHAVNGSVKEPARGTRRQSSDPTPAVPAAVRRAG